MMELCGLTQSTFEVRKKFTSLHARARINVGYMIAGVPMVATIFPHGKGRLYPAYSLSGSEGEENSPSLRARAPAYPQNNHQTTQSHLNHYNASQHKQRAYQQQQQHPLYHIPSSGAGLSDTPTSGNASDETLTDSDLITVARDSALLVHNGE
ncbi:hypothetical protein ANTPLA_LOCUS2600 [Anthophora plagiata]